MSIWKAMGGTTLNNLATGAGSTIGASSGYSDIAAPNKFFRIGECPLWIDKEWEVGTEIGDQSWDVPRDGASGSQAFEVAAVTWEVHTENERDLDQLIWLGSLSWDFTTTQVPIGPLSMFAGGIADSRFIDNKPGDMERLASIAGGQGPTEEAWRAFAQTLSLGKSLFFRGAQRYVKHTVMLPASAKVKLQLKMRQEHTTLSRLRFRVIFQGLFKSIIEIG
jgi:hypothetical protein